MIDDLLTMIPGPTPVHPRVLKALADPRVAHVTPEFVETFSTCLDDLRKIIGGTNVQPFILGGGGTLSMEMALVNIVAQDEKVLVISQGVFGDRYADLVASFGIDCDLLQAEWGTVVPPEELEALLAQNSYAAVTITHVDTSTGACAPAADYCALLKDREEMVILDGVCATVGIPEPYDEWGLDVLLTAPQKAFGVPAGLAMTFFSERAVARRKELEAVPAFYGDILRWLPIMTDPRNYYSTPCVNQIRALAEAAKLILEEGLEARYARHRRVAKAIRAGLDALGMKLFTSPHCLADTLSIVLYPEGIDDAKFRGAMLERGIVFAGAKGPLTGKAFRMGHMGIIDSAEVAKTVHAMEEVLKSLGRRIEPGSALAAAAPFLGEGE